MTAVQSEHVISSLRKQLSDAHLRVAMLEAQLMQLGTQQSPPQPVLVVPDDPAGDPPNGGVS